jgi:signal transduction histidine kinase
MGELRRLLELLREDGTEPTGSSSPLPGLAQLEPTINSVRGSGVSVTLEISGTPCRLDASTDLAAFRLVQEALTNVSKHRGAGAHATVSIEWDAQKVTLAVEDDGRGSTGMEESASEFPSAPTAGSLSTGNGLAGLRERIAVAGGDFVAGPTEMGGFRVAARLPVSVLTGGAARPTIPAQQGGGASGTGRADPTRADGTGQPTVGTGAGIDL